MQKNSTTRRTGQKSPQRRATHMHIKELRNKQHTPAYSTVPYLEPTIMQIIETWSKTVNIHYITQKQNESNYDNSDPTQPTDQAIGECSSFAQQKNCATRKTLHAPNRPTPQATAIEIKNIICIIKAPRVHHEGSAHPAEKTSAMHWQPTVTRTALTTPLRTKPLDTSSPRSTITEHKDKGK